MPMYIDLKCEDDPEANGRVPMPNDRRYTLKFPLDSGTELRVHMGREGYEAFGQMMGSMTLEDLEEECLRANGTV